MYKHEGPETGGRLNPNPSPAPSGRTGAAVIVPCAGQGLRMGGKTAKQFLAVEGKPVLAYTLSCLEAHPRIQRVVLVVPDGWQHKIQAEILTVFGFGKVTDVIAGGATRQASVACGLAALGSWEGPLLVHDGVRPLTPPEVFDRVIDSVLECGTGIAALPVTDTIKRASDRGWIVDTVPRHDLWRVQTPQGFWPDALRGAYAAAERSGFSGTDDASLLEACHQPVRLVPGDPWNVKITYPEDLALMEARLRHIKQTDIKGSVICG